MGLRIIQIFTKTNQVKGVEDILKQRPVLDIYSEKLSKGKTLIRAIVPMENTEEITDVLENYFSEDKDFRIIIMPVEVSIPRPEEGKKKDEDQANVKNHKGRVSREELYVNISKTADLSTTYIYLVLISSLIAVFGLLYSNVVLIIGAMIVAPLLGPHVALALSSTLADSELGAKAAKTIAIGFLSAIAISALIGYFLEVNPNLPEIALRTRVSLADVAIALAAGSAGVISFTSGSALTSLIGVMIAVAIIPPLVVFGMLLGSGFWIYSFSALVLLMINFVCINLAGIFTFLAQKIRPRTWWDADRAKRLSSLAVLIWILILSILIFLITLV